MRTILHAARAGMFTCAHACISMDLWLLLWSNLFPPNACFAHTLRQSLKLWIMPVLLLLDSVAELRWACTQAIYRVNVGVPTYPTPGDIPHARPYVFNFGPNLGCFWADVWICERTQTMRACILSVWQPHNNQHVWLACTNVIVIPHALCWFMLRRRMYTYVNDTYRCIVWVHRSKKRGLPFYDFMHIQCSTNSSVSYTWQSGLQPPIKAHRRQVLAYTYVYMHVRTIMTASCSLCILTSLCIPTLAPARQALVAFGTVKKCPESVVWNTNLIYELSQEVKCQLPRLRPGMQSTWVICAYMYMCICGCVCVRECTQAEECSTYSCIVRIYTCIRIHMSAYSSVNIHAHVRSCKICTHTFTSIFLYFPEISATVSTIFACHVSIYSRVRCHTHVASHLHLNCRLRNQDERSSNRKHPPKVK